MNSNRKSEYQFDVKVKPKVFPGLKHTVKVDLYCYEKLTAEPGDKKGEFSEKSDVIKGDSNKNK